MEHLEMHSLERENMGIGKVTLAQDANVSNAYDCQRKTGSTEQASPKVRFAKSMNLT
jgi:hypothetical protein